MQTIIENQLWIPLIVASLVLLALIGKAAEDRRKKQISADVKKFEEEEEELEEENVEQLPESFDTVAKEPEISIVDMEMPSVSNEVTVPAVSDVAVISDIESIEAIGLGLDIPSTPSDEFGTSPLPAISPTSLTDDFGIDEIPKLITGESVVDNPSSDNGFNE